MLTHNACRFLVGTVFLLSHAYAAVCNGNCTCFDGTLLIDIYKNGKDATKEYQKRTLKPGNPSRLDKNEGYDRVGYYKKYAFKRDIAGEEITKILKYKNVGVPLEWIKEEKQFKNIKNKRSMWAIAVTVHTRTVKHGEHDRTYRMICESQDDQKKACGWFGHISPASVAVESTNATTTCRPSAALTSKVSTRRQSATHRSTARGQPPLSPPKVKQNIIPSTAIFTPQNYNENLKTRIYIYQDKDNYLRYDQASLEKLRDEGHKIWLKYWDPNYKRNYYNLFTKPERWAPIWKEPKLDRRRLNAMDVPQAALRAAERRRFMRRRLTARIQRS